ncbi:GntR family transcriptional regulator [Anaerobium acetethylicum]|uniref:DNA-binding transcriptional regulator, GntR family n=1 Tax=Anaerobium acetethylicum TaxID=1619234 RepID=A0A1D3TVU4_9FIRM|nr:GntR family transcriptional regulator [Anaerobium acetethylicum]SCP98273.1 DNA-binding transcriptional regulator, GntR family [Anaerobium acetethylicum]
MQITDRNLNETAREYALRMLRTNIISLELKPGSSVSVYELSDELGISRTPVREALLELSRAKIIEVFPQKGSVIAYIDSDMVEEARFLRAVLEEAIVELACDVATEEDISELEMNINMQEVCLNNPLQGKLLQLDDEFHQKLYRMCKKEDIFTIKDMMSIHYDRVRNISLVAVKDLKVVNDHKEILKAIKNRDKEAAKAAMKKHLGRYSIDDERQMREKYPEYFKDGNRWFVDIK